ncbi:PAS domain S-box protein [Eubacteriaceae bacterium ES2]|nr:PAS domain S-box protein [Eubacteriaceae bacterium ES2]
MRPRAVFFIVILILLSSTNVLAADELLADDVFDKHGSVMLLINSSSGKIIDANPAAVAFYGYPHDDLISMNIADINILSEEEIKTEMNLAASEQRNYFLFKHQLEDGSIRDVEVYSSPVADENGDVLLLSIVHDVTPRMLAEEEAQRNSNIAYVLMLALLLLLGVTVILVNQSRIRDNRAKEKIEMEHSLLETVLDDATLGYWDWDLKENREYHSRSYKAMLGYNDDEIGDLPDEWQKLIFAEDRAANQLNFSQHVMSQGRVPFYVESRYRHKDGSIVWVISSGRVVKWDEEGKPLRMVGCHFDITRMKALEDEIIDERSLLKTILDSIADGVIAVDSDGKIRFINPIAEKLTGWQNKMAKGKEFSQVYRLLDEFEAGEIASSMEMVLQSDQPQKLSNQAIILNKSGEKIPVEESAAPIKDEDGKVTGAVTSFRDYSDQQKKTAEIHYLSYHDQLTGLYNRHFIVAEIKRLDRKSNLPISLVLIDVNGLKLTNDAFGHHAGDQLLQTVARILKEGCRENDIAARIGGDEFILILPGTTYDQAKEVVDSIRERISQTTMDHVIVSVSFGQETKINESQLMDEIFSHAEDAMYRNKMTESQIMRQKTIELILERLEKIDKCESTHGQKVVSISKKIGSLMALNDKMMQDLEKSARVHDIGKIAVSREILCKRGRLSSEEYQEMKRHPEIGYQMLKTIDKYASVAENILFHHEYWDGSGYPRGLSGQEIPLIARIIAVAESYEAMTEEKPYRQALSLAQALAELSRNAGSQFDPEIVKIWYQYCQV